MSHKLFLLFKTLVSNLETENGYTGEEVFFSDTNLLDVKIKRHYKEIHDVVERQPYSIELVADISPGQDSDRVTKTYKLVDKETTEIVYVQLNGYYVSYEGYEFESMYEVVPREQMIIVYDKI